MSDVTQHQQDSSEQLDSALGPGDVVADKYEVEKVIGTGGMGTVLAARHVQLGKRVAIKVLHGDLVSDPVTVKRFLREAQSTVDLRSEHAALVSDVGTLDNGTPYIIMEHLKGKDLETVLVEEGPLPLDDAVDYILQASVALADAHQNGLVHRDLKPGNLFLTHAVDGAPLVKVLDFGITKKITKSSGEQQRLTTTGLAVGTPLFMSPEQIRDAKSVDHRTDIWALGAVLHELLAGMPPFSAETITALSAMIAADDPPPLRSLRDEIPEEIEQAVLRCLEKRPTDRYDDVADFARAIAPFAPARAKHLVRRIERILGSSAPSTRVTDNWHPQDDLADTMVSTHPDGTAESGSPPPPSEPASPSALASSSPLGQTAGAWDAGAPPKSGSHALVVSFLAIASLIALLLWEPWAQAPPEGAPAASAPSPPSSQDEAPAPSALTNAPSAQPSVAEPFATSSATTSGSTVAAGAPSHTAPPSPSRPTQTERPKPPPATPPAPKPSYNLLDERK